MKKYVIISTDTNKEYANLLPLTCYSWEKIGYTPIIIDVIRQVDESNKLTTTQEFVFGTTGMEKYLGNAIIFPIFGIKGIRSGSVAQISRLFLCGSVNMMDDNTIVITSDADMVIGKDIFTEEADVVSYGHDLTGFGDLPICYIKATKRKWIELMQLKERGILDEMQDAISENAYSDDWNKYWDEDQKLLTKRAQEYGMDKILFVSRGNDQGNHGLPQGRWDRYKWENIPSEIIDVHMARNDLNAQVKVFETLFPNDDISWLKEFHQTLKQSK